MEQEILGVALANLPTEIGLKAKREIYVAEQNTKIDARVTFNLDGMRYITRNAVIRKEIRKHHILELKELQDEVGPVMLVAERLYPNIKKMLNETGIDWMDVAGNIHLKEDETLIWIDRHTTTPVGEKKNRAFTKTGLKVVFLFLHDEAWLNRTYRDIAEAADVALGNIKYVLDGLKEHGFIYAINKNVNKLRNREKLLDHWITTFTDELKPRIQKGRYHFINIETENNWKDLPLGVQDVWGGEPAADLLMNDLKPMEYILYTKKGRGQLMKEFKLVPDENGKVEIREPYWTVGTERPNVAPRLVIYTDLMITGDPRNIKAAKEINAEAITN
ncbi:MAG: type IV toxin-antitoxin system AbiEi family antitoxin [Cyclobacteriaceae bacterium]